MAVNMVPGRVVSRHERRSTWRADRGAGVKLFESRAFFRQLVQVGGLEIWMAVTSKVAPSLVVREEEDEVGVPRFAFVLLARGLC